MNENNFSSSINYNEDGTDKKINDFANNMYPSFMNFITSDNFIFDDEKFLEITKQNQLAEMKEKLEDINKKKQQLNQKTEKHHKIINKEILFTLDKKKKYGKTFNKYNISVEYNIKKNFKNYHKSYLTSNLTQTNSNTESSDERKNESNDTRSY